MDGYNMSKIEMDSQEIQLGTFDTVKEAEEAENNKTRKQPIVRCGLGLSKKQRQHYAYQSKSGRWYTKIRHPITKARLHVGCFDTAEEAAEAYDKKRREFELIVSDHNKEEKQSNNSHESELELISQGISSSRKVGVERSKKHQKRPCCGYPRKSVRWKSLTSHPITKARIFFGTFDTADEAGEAYDMVCDHNKEDKQLNNSFKDATIVEGKTDSTCDPSISTEGMEEETRGEFDLGIIDSYGQFIGEYSRLDDELWLCKPEDD